MILSPFIASLTDSWYDDKSFFPLLGKISALIPLTIIHMNCFPCAFITTFHGDVDDKQPIPEVLPQSGRASSCIATSSTRKKRWVAVAGDSLIKGAEGPVCWVVPHHREVCSVPGAWIRDIIGNYPTWCSCQTAAHYCSSGQVGRKLHHIVWVKWRETTRAWDGWWKNLGCKLFSLHSFQLQMMTFVTGAAGRALSFWS